MAHLLTAASALSACATAAAPPAANSHGALQYLAPFNPDWELSLELGHPAPTFQNLNFACNATMLAAAFAETKVPGFVSLEACFVPDGGVWDYATARKGLNGTGLVAGWERALAAVLEPALPLFGTGALVGVFLGDEMMCSKIPFSNYSAVAARTRSILDAAGFTKALIYSNECSTPLAARGHVWSVPEKLPPELDLFGLDLYFGRCIAEPPPMSLSLAPAAEPSCHPHNTDPMMEVRAVKAFVDAHVRPRLRPRQRIMLVPGLFGDRALNRSGTMEDQETFLVDKLDGYYAWAQADPDVAGLIPWHWLSPPKSYKIYSTIFGLGIEAFPRLIGRLEELGKNISAAAA
eukprot:SAG22_NODE_257_length_13543_cov_26.100417_7_plen_348_part_00